MTATKRPTASEVVELLSNTPRLICPCIDIPLASVQVERTDSLELIPSVRKPSGSVSRTNKPVLNSTNKRLKDHSGSSGYQTQNSNHNASSESTNNAPTPKSTNGAYSPMSGLLNYHSHSNGRTNTESPHPRIDFSGTIRCYRYHNVYRYKHQCEKSESYEFQIKLLQTPQRIHCYHRRITTEEVHHQSL